MLIDDKEKDVTWEDFFTQVWFVWVAAWIISVKKVSVTKLNCENISLLRVEVKSDESAKKKNIKKMKIFKLNLPTIFKKVKREAIFFTDTYLYMNFFNIYKILD